jgi:hypothetical protein
MNNVATSEDIIFYFACLWRVWSSLLCVFVHFIVFEQLSSLPGLSTIETVPLSFALYPHLLNAERSP